MYHIVRSNSDISDKEYICIKPNSPIFTATQTAKIYVETKCLDKDFNATHSYLRYTEGQRTPTTLRLQRNTWGASANNYESEMSVKCLESEMVYTTGRNYSERKWMYRQFVIEEIFGEHVLIIVKS